MTDTEPLTRLPQPEAPTQAAPALLPAAARRRLREPLTWLFVGPLLAYLVAFMVLPSVAVLIGAFRADDGHFTTQYVQALTQSQYLLGLKNTLIVSFCSAVLGAALGGVLAWLALGPDSPAWLRKPLTSFSGVASNFAGIPLALAFLMTLGSTGVVTRLLLSGGIDISRTGFSLYNVWGLVLVYLYFQIPLMVILISPALDGLRREWMDAAENLGASRMVFWRRIGLPLITPALLACTTMLFGNAFATYATPYALTSGTVALLPLQIAAVMTGNVLSEPQMGRAIALLIIVIMLITVTLYSHFDRLGSRWRS